MNQVQILHPSDDTRLDVRKQHWSRDLADGFIQLLSTHIVIEVIMIDSSIT
jgi:hypothetical protein